MMAYFVPAAHQLDLLVFVIGIAFVGKIANIIYGLQLKLNCSYVMYVAESELHERVAYKIFLQQAV